MPKPPSEWLARCRAACAAPAIGRLPGRIAPTQVQGFTFRAEPKAQKAFASVKRDSLVDKGTVLTVHSGDDVLGYLEVAAFRPGFEATRREVLLGVLTSI